ncbi:TadE/TadG family type IV pilus assembly protein [Kineosporia babensis]|uniref:Pilus assembly protein n=1 Tax=Kineosporia babensis TaxID=499548 RepID=A0A9X1SYA0_9ACTN|nr:TadE family protein [Kineosporia babensis]MCD5316120.1 pilus assembly protein [Kineosporia babensis]
MSEIPRGDEGASTVELMVWFPGLILISVMVLQVFSYVWARETSQSAARYGAHHARAYQGSDADGRRQALAYLDEVAGSLVEDPTVSVRRTATEVTVTITARPRQIPLPALRLRDFTVHSSGPIERFSPGP